MKSTEDPFVFRGVEKIALEHKVGSCAAPDCCNDTYIMLGPAMDSLPVGAWSIDLVSVWPEGLAIAVRDSLNRQRTIVLHWDELDEFRKLVARPIELTEQEETIETQIPSAFLSALEP